MNTTLTIRAKIIIGQAILTLLLLLISLLGYTTFEKLQENTTIFANQFLKAQGVILNADRDLYQALTAQQYYLITALTPEESNKLKDDFAENSQQALDRMNQYLDYMKDYPAVRNQLSQFQSDFSQWNANAKQVFALMDQGKRDEAIQQSDLSMPIFDKVRSYYNTGTESLEALAEETRIESSAVASSREIMTLVISAIAVLIGVLLIWLLPNMIVSKINLIKDKIEDIERGDGDLVTRIPMTTKDELGLLVINMNTFLDKLQSMIRDIKQNVVHLDDSSTQLQGISRESESLTKEQHMQLDGLVTAFTEINHAVKDIAQHAQTAASHTEEAQSGAEQGLVLLERNVSGSQLLANLINDASNSIQNLATESEKITSVLDVIRGIADQTNLLALNAAIEAARAGEQGRGFAVVADEVRTLASRTQQSTADIQNMILSLKNGVQSAVSAMGKGTEQMDNTLMTVQEASQRLQEIQQLITMAHDTTFQIATATEQQSTVINDINQSIMNLNDSTERQNALTSKSNTAGNAIATMTHKVRALVEHFKV